MREITRSVTVALNVVLQSFLSTSIYRTGLRKLSIAAFTAICSNICTARAQKRFFMNFRCKFGHRRSIRRPRFLIRVQNFGDSATLSVDFCILSHARTVVRECCKGDDESQWERGKFDLPPPKNPITDGHQNLCR